MSVKQKVSISFFVLVAFLAGIFVTTMGSNFLGNGNLLSESEASANNDLEERGDTALRDADVSSALALEDAFTLVADAVNPTVVQIRSEKVVAQGNVLQGTPFEQFFGPFQQEPNQNYRSQGLGSGVVIQSDGYIVTNNHVIEGADELNVRMSDGTVYSAEVIGTDPASDLAVIKIDASGLRSVSFGQVDNIRVGQWVMAVGSPLSTDLGNTVTVGIVSAMERTSNTISRLNLYSSFIQTDAAINPGNSGGPLVNLKGELVGINSAIYSRSGGYQGIGFAIPIDVVENVANQLIDNGVVSRGFLGVNFDSVSESLAEVLNVPRGAAQITAVSDGSAAEDAGLQIKDIIVSVDGQELMDANQLRTIVGNKLPGDRVELGIIRNDRERTINVTLGERPDLEGQIQTRNQAPEQEDSMEPLGLMGLRNLTPEIANELGIPDRYNSGVLITRIDQNSDAYREADLREGDIILEIDRQQVDNRNDFMRIYGDISSGESFLVNVLRVQGDQTVSFLTALTKP